MNTAQIKSKQNNRREVLKALFAYIPKVGVEYEDCSAEKFLNESGIDLSFQTTKDRVADFERAGILRRRVQMGTPSNGLPLGRHSHWTILLNEDEALAALDRLDVDEMDTYERNTADGNKRGAEKRMKARVALTVPTDKPAFTVRDGIAVEAIIGPDPESPMVATLKGFFVDNNGHKATESMVLIEAARQYRDRHESIDSKFSELVENARTMGVTIDVDAMREAIRYDHDERLESVALTLPYVDELERRVAKLLDEIEQRKSDTRELSSLRTENSRLKAQVERLIAEKVQR